MAVDYAPSCFAQASEAAGNRWQFLFIGDTNVEALRGTYRGSSWSLFQQGPKHWKMHFKSYKAAPFGLAGTEHLFSLLSRIRSHQGVVQFFGPSLCLN